MAGILTVLTLGASSLLVRHSPSTDQPTADITSYFTANRASALLAAGSSRRCPMTAEARS